jgi:hypothetical protein
MRRNKPASLGSGRSLLKRLPDRHFYRSAGWPHRHPLHSPLTGQWISERLLHRIGRGGGRRILWSSRRFRPHCHIGAIARSTNRIADRWWGIPSFLGTKTFLATPATEPACMKTDASAVTSTFFLTLTNPMTILSFLAIFAGFGLASDANNYSRAMLITLGVFVGSAAWWLFLSKLLRTGITARWMQQVNRVSGVIILGFAVTILLHVFG